MGIEIIASWTGQTEGERKSHQTTAFDSTAGHTGYLWEEYLEELQYATRYLCREAFHEGEARIKASVLKERLPRALILAERIAYDTFGDERYIERVKQSFRDFVALCTEKERETGEPVLITANY